MKAIIKDPAFKDSEALDKLAHRLAAALPELIDAQAANWKAFYSKHEPEERGGKCRKLDGAVRYQENRDYYILIHYQPFVEMDDLHRVRIIIHELNHILKEKENFVVRHHAGDFCEIAEHDRFCYRLALKAMGILGIKYGNAEEVKRYAHIDRLDSRNALTKEVVNQPDIEQALTDSTNDDTSPSPSTP